MVNLEARDAGDSERILTHLQGCGNTLKTLRFQCRHQGIADLAALGVMPQLATLCVKAEKCALKNDATGLSSFRNFPNLRDLSLDLWENMLGPRDARCFVSAIQPLSQLQSLHLDFSCNRLQDEGAKALGWLRVLPCMEYLWLCLDNNDVGDPALFSLALLRKAKTLVILNLMMRLNRIEDEGAIALCALAESNSIETLELHLNANHIGDAGAVALAGLKHAPRLRTVVLSLVENGVRDAGAHALAGVAEPVARCWAVDLRHNCLSAGCVHALARLPRRSDHFVLCC
eukprot:EG_transcript_20185